VSDPNATTPGDADVTGATGATPWPTSPSEPAFAPAPAASEEEHPFGLTSPPEFAPPAAPAPSQPAAPVVWPGQVPGGTTELAPVPAPAAPYSTQHQPTAPYPVYPAGAYQTGSAPVSATPYSVAPYSAAPYSAAPYSAAPYSAAPYSVMPYPVAQPPSKWNRLAIVFGSLALVLLLAAGAVTTLYILHRGEASKTSTDQQAQISALEDQLGDTKDDLTDTKSELRKTQVDLTDAEEELATVAEGCPKAVQEFFDAVKKAAQSGRTGSPEATSAANRMIATCGVSV
jgi:hypothetical protein